MKTFENGYALVIGVADYRCGGLPPFSLATLNDAVDFARTLWDPDICGYRADRVRLLLDDQATAKGILHGLDWLAERCEQKDTAIVFFSGHGWQSGGISYLAAHGARLHAPQEGLIAGDELANRLQAIPAGRLAVFLDSCYAGGIAEIKGTQSVSDSFRSGLDEHAYENLSKGSGRVLLASSGPGKQSMILEGSRNSLFTSCLLRGLRGEAASREEGVLSVSDLFHFTTKEVRRLSAGQQQPLFKGLLSTDFAIAQCNSPHVLNPQSTRRPVPDNIQVARDFNRTGDIHYFRTGDS